ncbi:MAG: glycosyltransferase family 4 protein [Methylobacterium mesophilicum]|nr:glycosyltransferase family 4 protein [Methylobacterium mesophilicum]
MPRILLGAATLAADRGGIARVARLTGRVITETGHRLDAVSYLDGPETGAPFAFAATGASKTRFAAQAHWRGIRADFSIHDSLGIAQAHPRLPGLRKPYAVWLHGIEAWRELSPRSLAVLRGAGRLFVNSRHTLERVTGAHGPLPEARICHLATEEDAAPPCVKRAGPPTVLILGRIDVSEAYKGHRELIDAWPAVLRHVPEARLLVAGGETGLGALMTQARASAAAGAITFLGHVPQPDIDALWHQATLFAMPSRGEGFGLVYAEAMRHGVPVIASRHDAGSEVNRDGETGFSVDLDEPGALAERIARLLSDPVLAGRMGEAARRRWQAEFSYSRFRTRFGALLDEWIGESAKARR